VIDVTTTIGVARLVAGVLPSALLVLAVLVISVLALLLGDKRRGYALDVVDRMLSLAAVLVGVEHKPQLPSSGRHL